MWGKIKRVLDNGKTSAFPFCELSLGDYGRSVAGASGVDARTLRPNQWETCETYRDHRAQSPKLEQDKHFNDADGILARDG